MEGVYPIERWRPGQHIRDRERIGFPAYTPPGVYTVYVGLFKKTDRIPVTPTAASDVKNRLRVTTIRVE